MREKCTMVQTKFCCQKLFTTPYAFIMLIKRGRWFRKRGRRRWLNIFEKQPELVTSGDQVPKQMAH